MRSFVALWLVACSGGEATPEPTPAPAPVPVPEPPPPEPVEMTPMTVDAVNADATMAGKPVTVKGYYTAMTKVSDPPSFHVPVFADAAGKTGKVVCVVTDVTKEPEIAALTAGSEITVKGTVAAEKIEQATRLDTCEIVPATTTPTEGKVGKEGGAVDGEGKAGKGKGKKAPH
jgi:hypothetical protein